MPGQTAILAIKIISDASQAAKGMDDASGMASKLGGAMRAVPVAAAVAALGAMTKGAAEDAQAQAVLATQLRNTTGATNETVASVEDWIAKTSLATGVADDQLRPAMAALARGTGDVTEAQKAMSVALDVAAATGKPVETVADAIAKGYGGQMTALSKLVPGMDKAIVSTGDMNAVMAELQRTTGGASAAAADTAAGKMQRLNVAVSETKESIGAAFLPALEAVLPMLGQFAEFIQKNAEVVGPLVVILGILVIVLWAVNAAIAANPITWIIIAIAAFIAVIVIAYQKSATFRDIVQGTWDAIKTAALFVWNNILKPIFAAMVAYYSMLWTAAQEAAAFVIAAWNWIKDAAIAAYSWVKTNVIDPYIAAYQLLMSWAGTAKDALVNGWRIITDAIRDAWNFIKGVFDGFIDKIQTLIDWIKKIKLPDWMTNAASAVGDIFRSAPATSTPAPTVRGLGAPATMTAGGATRAALAPTINVSVILDGRKVGGYVDRIITDRLDAEGALLATGSWGANA